MWTDLKDCDLFLFRYFAIFVFASVSMCISSSFYVTRACLCYRSMPQPSCMGSMMISALFATHTWHTNCCAQKCCISPNFETQIRTQSINQKQYEEITRAIQVKARIKTRSASCSLSLCTDAILWQACGLCFFGGKNGRFRAYVCFEWNVIK